MPPGIPPSVRKHLRAGFHPKLHQTFPDHNNKALVHYNVMGEVREALNNSHHANTLELNK